MCEIAYQAKALEEVDALGHDYTPTYEDMEEKIPYLTAVIKETMRLYPAAHLIVREAVTDLNIHGKKAHIIARSSISAQMNFTHSDKP